MLILSKIYAVNTGRPQYRAGKFTKNSVTRLSLPPFHKLMMNFSNASLAQMAVHYVGNKSQTLQLSDSLFVPDDDLKGKLLSYFLSPFANAAERYEFTHPNSLQFNEVFNYITSVFTSPASF